MKRRPRLLAGVGVTACLLLASGCSATSSSTPPPTQTETTQSAVVLPGGRSSAAAPEPQDELAEPSFGAEPSWDPTAQGAAGEAATRAVTAYLSAGAEDAWWTGVAPLLSPVAQQAYAGTDPANVPGRVVNGPPTVTDAAGSAYLAEVVVPTDAGDYGVLLSRAAEGDPWLVERFRVPEPRSTP